MELSGAEILVELLLAEQGVNALYLAILVEAVNFIIYDAIPLTNQNQF